MADPELNQLRIPLRIDRNLAYQIAQQRKQDSKLDNRSSKRFAINYGTRLQVTFERSDGEVIAEAITKDMSDDGLGLWVGAFIHPKTRCSVTIPTDSGGTLEVEGEVRWCKHFAHSVHELGIQISNTSPTVQALEETLSSHLKTLASDFADVCTGVETLLSGLRTKVDAGLLPDELLALVSTLESLIHREDVEFLTAAMKTQKELKKLTAEGADGEQRDAA